MILEFRINRDAWPEKENHKKPRSEPFQSVKWKPKTPNYDTYGKTKEDIWREAWEHGLRHTQGQGQWKDQYWHPTMVNYLQLLGLENEANELELVRPTEEDIAFGKKPNAMANTGKDRESFIAARETYSQNVEHILDTLAEIGESKGWLGD